MSHSNSTLTKRIATSPHPPQANPSQLSQLVQVEQPRVQNDNNNFWTSEQGLQIIKYTIIFVLFVLFFEIYSSYIRYIPKSSEDIVDNYLRQNPASIGDF